MPSGGHLAHNEFFREFASHVSPYVRQTKEEREQAFYASQCIRQEIKANRIPFITDSFLSDFYLCQGLVLVGARTGRSKSSVCANLIAGFLRASKKECILITNEESIDTALTRIACIQRKTSFYDYFHDKLSPFEEGVINEEAKALTARVEVVDTSVTATDTLEGVVAVLNAAAESGVGAVFLDYFQTVQRSVERPELEPFSVLKKLGIFLKDYGKAHAVPVVALVQLSGETDGATFSSRIQHDKTIENHAFISVEVVPDFATSTTKFVVHKDRWSGHTGKEVVMDFKNGRLVMQKENGPDEHII